MGEGKKLMLRPGPEEAGVQNAHPHPQVCRWKLGSFLRAKSKGGGRDPDCELRPEDNAPSPPESPRAQAEPLR